MRCFRQCLLRCISSICIWQFVFKLTVYQLCRQHLLQIYQFTNPICKLAPPSKSDFFVCACTQSVLRFVLGCLGCLSITKVNNNNMLEVQFHYKYFAIILHYISHWMNDLLDLSINRLLKKRNQLFNQEVAHWISRFQYYFSV